MKREPDLGAGHTLVTKDERKGGEMIGPKTDRMSEMRPNGWNNCQKTGLSGEH